MIRFHFALIKAFQGMFVSALRWGRAGAGGYGCGGGQERKETEL